MTRSQWALTGARRARLEHVAHTTRDARVLRRALALLAVNDGQGVTRVAHELRMGRSSLHRWMARYAQRPSVRVLYDRPRAGRPSRWNAPARRALTVTMKKPPDERGYWPHQWTVPLLRGHLARHDGPPLSPATLRRELHARDYAWKRGKHLLDADPQRGEKDRAYPPAYPGVDAGVGALGRG